MVIGFMAAPDNPPVVLPRRDLRLCASIHSAGEVFAITTASAPAASDAFALTPIILTFGESLTHKGRFAAARAAPTTAAVREGSVLYSIPPHSTFGQEIFSSYAASPSASSRTRITST